MELRSEELDEIETVTPKHYDQKHFIELVQRNVHRGFRLA